MIQLSYLNAIVTVICILSRTCTQTQIFLALSIFFFFLILVFNPSLFYSDSLVSYYINNEEDVLMPECFC